MKRLFAITTAALLFGSCAMDVHTRVDRQVDFSRYKTFCWMAGCEFKVTGPTYLVNDSALRESVKASIVKELNSKGLTEDDNNPDLLVAFNITVKDEQSIVYVHPDETPFYEKMETEAKVYNYLKGSIVIAMADKKDSKIVWESMANRYMELNPDLSEKNIAKGIHLVLKDFPPRK